MGIVVVFQLKLILYMDEDELIVMGKFVFFYSLIKKCRGPPHTLNSQMNN